MAHKQRDLTFARIEAETGLFAAPAAPERQLFFALAPHFGHLLLVRVRKVNVAAARVQRAAQQRHNDKTHYTAQAQDEQEGVSHSVTEDKRRWLINAPCEPSTYLNRERPMTMSRIFICKKQAHQKAPIVMPTDAD